MCLSVRGVVVASTMVMGIDVMAGMLTQGRMLARQLNASKDSILPSVRFVALAHTEGCGVSDGEPEEIYFRYYLRLGNDWNPTTDGGKLPGISATYSRVGWGGRKADGMTGWSMRGR